MRRVCKSKPYSINLLPAVGWGWKVSMNDERVVNRFSCPPLVDKLGFLGLLSTYVYRNFPLTKYSRPQYCTKLNIKFELEVIAREEIVFGFVYQRREMLYDSLLPVTAYASIKLNLRNRFWWAYIWRKLYPGGRGFQIRF